MEKRTLTATTEDAGTRLDSFLAGRLEGVTRSAAARLIESGCVTVDGKPAGKSVRMAGGETVCVLLPEAEEPEARPEDIPLDVVYEDSDVIVVNKPVGMVVHPAAGHPDGTLVNALLHHCAGSLSGVGGQLRPGIVHRIDRDTSGLIIAAKNDAAHAFLAAQLATTPCAAPTSVWRWGILRRTAAPWTLPSGGTGQTAKKWPLCRTAAAP